MAKTGKGPKALVLNDCEAIVAVGAIISELPCVDQIDVTKIETGMHLEVDGDSGTVEIK
jgi:predicted aconitase with swiveling domain